jgi:hypothetical protein
MDKLAKQLRDDALRIDADVSDELDARIRASLHGITPEARTELRPRARPASFWWWSTVTGATAALAVIAIVNLQTPDPAPAIAQTTPAPLKLPEVDWKAREAVLTSPLEQEIEDLQADLKKAEEAVKEDIDRLF